jgi:hypothetical protein
MEKIVSREHLIDYAERVHHTPRLIHLMETVSQTLNQWHGYPYKIINPRERGYIDQAVGFKDLPDDFFVDLFEVQEKYTDRLHEGPTKNALLNTCLTRENFWVFREAMRFEYGEYDALTPIKSLVRMGLYKPSLVLHFPHASVDDPTMLAYTPSHEYGKRDRQVRIKVGKYLTQYYSDVLTPEQIRAFANGMKNMEVKWATDRDGFRYVYQYGPGSCMSGKCFDNIYGDYHPVDVYDSGEFKLAYIEPVERHILARGFVHEPSKTWVRVYGDEGQTLADHFEGQGYTKADSWAGAKLLHITDDDDRVVMPYLDGDDKGVIARNGFFYVTEFRGKADYWCDFTDGVIEHDDNSEPCGDCGDSCDPDDMYWSEYHERSIGSCCIDNYRGDVVYNSRGRTTWVHEDDCIYCDSNDTYYVESIASEFDIVQATDGSWYCMEDVVETYDGQYAHESDVIHIGQGQYAVANEVDGSLIVQFDGAEPIHVWHEDFMDGDIQEMYENDPRVTTDSGVSVGLRFRTVNEIILSLGIEYATNQLHRAGFSFGEYVVRWRHERLNQLYSAAA